MGKFVFQIITASENILNLSLLFFDRIVEHWSCRFMFAMVAMGTTQFATSNSGTVGISNSLSVGHHFCHRCTNDC